MLVIKTWVWGNLSCPQLCSVQTQLCPLWLCDLGSVTGLLRASTSSSVTRDLGLRIIVRTKRNNV